jgi:uncharacterized protein YndB with AHSA1/START domain
MNRQLTITRIFEAPVALVWQAWLDPQAAMQWWGPKHHPAVEIEWDVRTGRRWRNCLRSVETGELLWHGGVFHEVVEQQRLIFTFTWEQSGERGMETLITITFTDQAGKTRMTLQQSPFQSTAEQDGHDEGWNSTFDRLAEFLEQQA